MDHNLPEIRRAGIENLYMEEWEATLRRIFSEIDVSLENTYGISYPLHPSRLHRGEAANNAYDGLFSVGASFSAGYGSVYGRGWVFDIHMSTLSPVDGELTEKIYHDAVLLLRKLLKKYYPERNIRVKKDGKVYKIFGDLQISYKNPD